MSESLLELKNPHSVRAVLKNRPRDVQEIFLTSRPQGAWNQVVELAEKYKIPLRLREQEENETPGKKAGRKQERTGHAVAMVRPKQPVSLEKLFADVDPGESPAPLWMGLDTLQDPHNVGAIFRTAAFFGVRGIVLTKNQTSPVNATVYDIAAGGVEAVPFAIEINLRRALKTAKKAGLWVLGASEHAETPIWNVSADRPWMMLVGNEQKGLRRLTLEHCDELCGIPSQGDVGSLNVSVATGIMVSHLAAHSR